MEEKVFAEFLKVAATLSQSDYIEKLDDCSFAQKKQAAAARAGASLGTKVTQTATPEELRRATEADLDTSALAQGLVSETSRLGWFLYFLKEAKLRGDKTEQQRQSLLRVIQKYLQKKQPGPGLEFKAPVGSVDPLVLRADMTELLKIGFSAMCGFGEGHGASDCSDAALLQFRRSGQVYQEVDYRWRADSRDFEAVKSSQGFHTKADSEGYAKANGMRDPYHPFSDPAIRKYLWFRRGQTDNCLYTVVSIGKSSDWKSYLPFPKVERTLAAELFSASSRAPLSSKYSEKYAMCKVGGISRSIKLPVTETWLYMFLLTGLVVETNRIQAELLGGKDSFPEEGVQEIPMADIFGAIKFYRFHHGPDDEDGFTAVPASGGVLQFRNPFFQESKYSKKGFDKLLAAFSEAPGSGPVSLRWTASGYAAIPSKFRFRGDEIEVTGLSLQQ